MNKKVLLIRTLSCLELLFAASLFIVSLFLYINAVRVIESESVKCAAQTLEESAAVLASHRAAIDNGGKELPLCARALRECAALLDGEILAASREAERLATGQQEYGEPLINILTRMMPERMKKISGELNRTLPELSDALNESAEILEGHTPEHHQKLMATVDNTVMTMRLLAGDIRQIQRKGIIICRLFLLCSLLLAVVMGLNAGIFMVVLCDNKNR